MRKRRLALALFLFLPLLPAPAGAVEEDLGPEIGTVWVNAYEEEMNRTLDEAEAAAAAGDWRKAAGLYQEAADRATNQVRRVARQTYLGIREYVKSRIRSWPEEGLAVYRSVVDPRVGERYRAAIANGLADPLREIVRRYPLATDGARAMLDLGTRAIARGDADAALRPLLEILRLYPEGPIPNVRRADVIARAALAAAKRGDEELVREMSDRARRLPPEETIAVAGEEKGLAAFVDSLTTVPAGTDAPAGWPTTGGSFSRGGGRSGPSGPLVPYWIHEIPESRPSYPPSEEDEPKAPLFPVQPLVTGGQVVLGETLFVEGFPLPEPGRPPTRGRPEHRWAFPGGGWDLAESLHANSQKGQDPVFLSAAGDLVALPFPDPADGPNGQGYEIRRNALVTLSLAREGTQLDQKGGSVLPDGFEEYAFCGSPAVAGNRLWIAGTRPGSRVETLCFGFEIEEPGHLRTAWRTSVCIGRPEESGSRWFSGFGETADASSVAVRNGIVYLCSNTGAVAALDGGTGEILWIHKYERTERAPDVFARASRNLKTWYPNPPMLDHRCLYVAPEDSDRLLVYFQLPDLRTGYVVHGRFSRDDVGLGFEPRYLLGVRDGVVFLAGETRSRGERPLFAVKTEPAWLASDERPGDPQRILWRAEIEEDAPWGRGAVAGDAIYFPTKKGIYRVAVADGAVTKVVDPADEALAKLAGDRDVIGNLAVAGPWLVSASEKIAVLFGPPPPQEPAPEKDAEETGD